MKSSVEKVSSLGRKINVMIASQDVDKAYDAALKELQRRAEVKGFRKGKAPIDTLKRIYGDSLVRDIAEDLIQSHYPQALREHEIKPISFPEIQVGTLKEGADFEFTAHVEIRPEVEVRDFKGLPVNREKLPNVSARVDEMLEQFRKNLAETVPVFEDRPARTGDVAEVSFVGNLLTGPLENGSSDSYEVELGSNQMIPGFESGIEGMKVGEGRTLQLKFPDDYHAKEIAGQPVSFEVKLKALKAKRLPEINDEFAKKLGDFETVAQVREKISSSIVDEETRRIDEAMKNQVIEALVNRNPMELPLSLVKEQMKAIGEDVRKRLDSQGLGEAEVQEYLKKWGSDVEASARFMVHSSFLIDKLAHDHNLGWKREDIDAKIEEMSKTTGLDVEKLREFYSKDDDAERLGFRITEEKVVKFLLDHAAIKDVDPQPSKD